MNLIPVRQPSSNGEDVLEFFLTKMNATDLFSFAEVDRLRLEKAEVPKYSGIQRAIVESRVKAIRAYLGTYLPVLPNCIILAIHGSGAEEFEKQRATQAGEEVMRASLPLESGSFTIIDGQHRTAALDAAPAGFEIPVAMLIDPDLELMAYIFNKINSTQKPVNPSISYQLFGYSKTNSPQKLAHEVVMALSKSKKSPFRRKMRLLGTKDDWANDSYALTQSTFARELLRMVSANPLSDEYALMSGDRLKPLANKPFRRFLVDYDPVGLALEIERWFTPIAETWPEEWANTKDFNLAKSTGISGWMRAIHRVLEQSRATEPDSKAIVAMIQDAKSYLDAKGLSFTSEDFPSSGAGINALRDVLVAGLTEQHP